MAFYSRSDRIETSEPSDYDDNLPSFVEELIKNPKRPLSTFRTALKEYEESEYKAFASPFESGESVVDCICEIGGGEDGLKYLHPDTFVSCFERRYNFKDYLFCKCPQNMHCRRAKCDHYHIVFVTHRKPRSDHLKANFIEDLNLAVETQKINKKTTFKRFFKAEVHRAERITPFSREIHILPILFGGVEGLDLMSKEAKKNQLCKRDLQCMGRFETFIKNFPEWYLSIKHRIEHPDCFEKSDWKTFSPEPEINLTAERQPSEVEETDLMSDDDETLPDTEDPLNPPKEHPYASFYQLFQKYGPIPIQEARKTFSLEDLTKIIPNASEKMYEKAREKYIHDIIQKCPFEDFYELLSNKDDADDTKFEPKEFTYTFLDSLFERQEFSEDDKCRFCNDLYSILEKTSGKVNALFLWGPPSSGKSMLTDLVRKVMVLDAEYTPGRNSYNFSSCTSATLIVFEDMSSLPTTSMPTLKCLFEGRPTQVAVKHKSHQKIERTPIIITSNFELKKLFDKELNTTNLDAFEKRIIQYQFPTTWDSSGIQPNVNPKHFLQWLKENKNKYTTSSEAHSQRKSQAYMDQSGYINPADEQH